MQQEDDLRGLAKVMEFMRAVSIIFVVIHVYWCCFGAIERLNADIDVVGRILLNFDRTAGLFGNLLTTKMFAVIFLALSCLGTQGVKNEKVTWEK
ncbi:MAG: YWFCY domain-containing protein, partial [Rikenellaceae bacterium]|nr:YWFCY domain-containing protein [Rikenellaceae bacterium]